MAARPPPSIGTIRNIGGVNKRWDGRRWVPLAKTRVGKMEKVGKVGRMPRMEPMAKMPRM